MSRRRRAEYESDESPSQDERLEYDISAVDEDDVVSIASDDSDDEELSTSQQQVPDLNSDDAVPIVPLDPAYQAKLDRLLPELTGRPRRHFFITGPPGSGKSNMIKAIKAALEAAGKTVAVVAPTGSAAVNIGGRTIHNFFGLTPSRCKKDLTSLVQFCADDQLVCNRLRSIHTLIIDEISMVPREFLEQLNAIATQIRPGRRLFGGIRIIVVGDFGQISPVSPHLDCVMCGFKRTKQGQILDCAKCGPVEDKDKWAFRARIWHKLRFTIIVLDQMYRQRDERYKAIIWAAFLGNDLSRQQLRDLNDRRVVPQPAVYLFSSNERVDIHNSSKFRSLPGPAITYVAHDHCELNAIARRHPIIRRGRDRFESDGTLVDFKGHRFPQRLQVKKEMPVILLKNLDVDRGLVNGSMGKVIGFQEWDPADARAGKSIKSEHGYNTNGSEGITNSHTIPSLRGDYQDFRCRGSDRFFMQNTAQSIPIVRFENGQTQAIAPACEIDEDHYDNGGLSIKSRVQIPLVAAWASTIHRAQGLTIERCIVDLQGCFDPGQSYVALSRARSLEGMQIMGLRPYSLHHDPTVLDFMKRKFPAEITCQMLN